MPPLTAPTGSRGRATGGNHMTLPRLDISTVPDLDVRTGLFGSFKPFDPGLVGSNDLLLLPLVYVYEAVPTQTVL